ncbi:hypothetical protein B0A55_01076 [Friedmanniomyces simplex]|uniref:Protein kinase domain-containing protein n=1 Tax=Friedmanniomyces simplex TaxID=329884 RepID=A0A4U0Y3P5_9PEZI|nr:hypothetical protein B0A55_01076 [Friedmanniomyces simplex]
MAAVAHPTRPQIRRNSPLAVHNHHHPAFSTAAPAWQSFGGNDSDSDGDAPPAPNFSKVTQDLLADTRAPSSPPKQEQVREAPRFNRSLSANKAGLDTPSRAPHIKVIRKSSPSVLGQDRGHTPPRIVMLGGKGPGSGARSISISGPYPQRPSFAVKHEPIPEPSGKPELVTPAPAPRALRVTRTRAGSNASQDGQAHPPSSDEVRLGPQPERFTSPRARDRDPIRFIYHQSVSQRFSGGRAATGISAREKGSARYCLSKSQYRIAPPKVHTDASEDQENMPPPTFRRNKDQEFKYLGQRPIAILSDDEKPGNMKPRMPVEDTPVPVPPQQQERRALGTISGNTPHRAAPAPPPKMSVLNTATTTAGASVTKSKKKRSHIVVNGKIFTQMGKIGKGGSSDVYCVMAENYKTFALKRVKLDNCDEGAVRGYKGEIDLLKKLTEVERVVRLFDWELNEEKQELCVLMEKGDTDLNRILTLRLNGVDATFDGAFTRYHWKEMLECVQAVHDHDIVHSDLKPANFLLVQGRLKLIDFGIANAIETDHTVNVHRDSHVGTPNYMSPESITDTNASQPDQMTKDAAGRPLKKDMRIGKASDVWSLGCILYQMTYGRPPFAHIQNQISRIMAITNPRHIIEYPETGVGESPVAPPLRGLLRRCLDRDPEKRPTIPEMVREDEVWLHPEAGGAVMITESLLSQIIGRVVERCGKDGVADGRVPGEGEWRTWAGGFLGTIRKMQAGG